MAKALVALICLCAAASAWSQGTWSPQSAVEISVPSGPGGGTDHTARIMQKIVQGERLLNVPLTVANKSGGGGLVALTYLRQYPGNAHYVQVASAIVLSNHISGRSALGHTDVTPIALLQSEYVVLAVKSDSPLKSTDDLVGRLKRDAGGVSFAVGTSLGGANHVAAAAVARAAGIDPKKLRAVVFKSSSESAVSALGGHTDVMAASASLAIPHVRSGTMRILGVSAPKRLTGELAAVPTLKEHDIDATANNFRLLIGPPGLAAAQLAFWDQTTAKIVQADEWSKDLEASLSENTYLNSRDVRPYLEAEYAELKKLLTMMGMAKQ